MTSIGNTEHTVILQCLKHSSSVTTNPTDDS